MATVKWTEEAESTLRDVHDYISRNRPTTARRTIESILSKVSGLAAYPTLGQRYPYDPNRDVHVLTYGHFRIAYRIEASGEVLVLGVFHGLIFLPPR
ncbi:MAG: type II toxin-antitoxin system RelE/ParE family toxin [Acidobacteriota bacterium]